MPRLWLLGVSEDQSHGGSPCCEAEVHLDMPYSAACKPTGQTGAGRLDHPFHNSHHRFLLGVTIGRCTPARCSPCAAEIAAPEMGWSRRACVCRARQVSQQLRAHCRSEPALSPLQQNQFVLCCDLKAPMNIFILTEIQGGLQNTLQTTGQEPAAVVPRKQHLLLSTNAEARNGVWVAMGAERGEGTFASSGAGGCFVPGLSHDCG